MNHLRGNNTMLLNTATMISIMQEWCDRTMNPAPKVSGFSPKQSAHSATFEVDLTDKEGK